MRGISEKRLRDKDGVSATRELGMEVCSDTDLISYSERLQEIVVSLLIRNEELRECIRAQETLQGDAKERYRSARS